MYLIEFTVLVSIIFWLPTMYNVLKYRKTWWNNDKISIYRNCNGTAFFVDLIKTSTVQSCGLFNCSHCPQALNIKNLDDLCQQFGSTKHGPHLRSKMFEIWIIYQQNFCINKIWIFGFSTKKSVYWIDDVWAYGCLNRYTLG